MAKTDIEYKTDKAISAIADVYFESVRGTPRSVVDMQLYEIRDAINKAIDNMG